MSAGGVVINHNGATRNFLSWISTNFILLEDNSFAGCYWMNIRGASSGSDGEGQFAMYLPKNHAADNGGILIGASDATTGTPWSIFGRLYNGGAPQDVAITSAPAANENWFFGFSWDSAADQITWFFAKDQDSSVGSTTGTAGYDWLGSELDGISIGDADAGTSNKGANLETRNHKYWSTTKTASDMLAEMKSESVVSSSSIFAHYKLASSTDLNDYSGNARHLTMTGTVTTGTMDPVDLQGGSAPFHRQNLQRLPSGLYVHAAVSIDGLIEV